MPVPMETKANVRTSRPCPCSRSASVGGVDVVLDHQLLAERLAQARPAPPACPSRPGRPPARSRCAAGRRRRGCRSPSGSPSAAAMPAPPHSSSARPTSSATRPLTLDARDRTADRPMTCPLRSATRAAQVLLADVQAQYVPGVRPDLVQQRRAAGHAGPLAGLPDQPGALHVGQGQRDRRLGQPGQPGQVGPRAAARAGGCAAAAAARSAPAAAAAGRPGRRPWRRPARPHRGRARPAGGRALWRRPRSRRPARRRSPRPRRTR